MFHTREEEATCYRIVVAGRGGRTKVSQPFDCFPGVLSTDLRHRLSRLRPGLHLAYAHRRKVE